MNTKNPFFLEGRTVLITGASSGIGRSVAIRASQAGARIIACGTDSSRLKGTLELLRGNDHQFRVFNLESDTLEEEIFALCKDAGPLGGLVHSAGISDVTLLRDIDKGKAERMMYLNWFSFLGLAKSVCRRGRYMPGLSVVALSSVAALRGQIGLSVYAASKGALTSTVMSLAAEYASRGIRFNCVSPCSVNTPMQHVTRVSLGEDWFQRETAKSRLGLLEPEDVADPVVFLLSEASRRITGINLVVDGGWSLS